MAVLGYLKRLILPTVLIGMAILPACIGNSPEPLYYALNPMIESANGAGYPNLSVTIGPVHLPSFHDRPQIVVRDGASRYKFDEFHRWSGSLGENIAAVLAANLGRLLGTDKVTPYTGDDLLVPDYRLILIINRFDGGLTDSFFLDVTWSIRKPGVENPVVVKKTTFRENISPDGYDGLTAAQSRALASLCRAIAGSFREIRSDRK